MKVSELAEKLQLKRFTSANIPDKEISGGYVSDLLSDVMGYATEGNVWITLQNHLNVVAIASLKDIACVVLVKGIEPPAQVIAKANEEQITILGSNSATFELVGEIYKMLA